MIKKEMICICCPLGCMLTIQTNTDNETMVSGNSCPKGEVYAKKEVTDPRRIVTTTVRVNNKSIPTLPVKTKEGIPKDKIMQCMMELAEIVVETPVSMGDVIVANIADTGIDVVVSSSLAEIGEHSELMYIKQDDEGNGSKPEREQIPSICINI
jgi:CxxC motif-containing protein